MSSHVLRTILAGLLIATISAKIWRPHNITEVDTRAAVVALVTGQGWSAYDEAATSPNSLGKAINFWAPECEALGQVFAIDLGLQLAPMLDGVIRPGYTRRFVYIDRTWLTEDRFGMRLEWLKYRVLSIFGLGRYVANETALVIAEPHDCRVADKVGWSAVWERRTRSTRLPNADL
jgi:hypothetical protein